MTKILTETSRSIEVTETAKSGAYEYAVTYNYKGKELLKFLCTITKVEQSEGMGELRTYSGSMTMEMGNKTLNFPAHIETAAHIVLFEQMLAEVKEEIENQ